MRGKGFICVVIVVVIVVVGEGRGVEGNVIFMVEF